LLPKVPAPHLARSVPLKKGLDDAMIALYQNGERLMPANGYPMRLLLPGWEGNMNIKYLRRIKLVEEPAMGYWESKIYAPLLPGGKAYQFYLLQEVESFITQPSPGLSVRGPGLSVSPPAGFLPPADGHGLTDFAVATVPRFARTDCEPRHINSEIAVRPRTTWARPSHKGDRATSAPG
jgi:hypothetical protein